MITARFVFRQAHEDAEFRELNERILEAARSNPGFEGREAWSNDRGDVAVVYYWSTIEALEAFADHPVHRRAKARYDEWYEGYRVEIARVLRSYGDGFYSEPSGGGPTRP